MSKFSDRLEATESVWKPDPRILLCPNTPEPLHGIVPRDILGRKWWNATRKVAYASTNFHCLACGVSKYKAKYHQWLEGHEVYRINYGRGRATYIKTVPLCHFCHNYIHDGRLRALLAEGKLHQAKLVAIIQHGEKVLAEAGLTRLPPSQRLPKGKIAKWEDWRLVLDGEEYGPNAERRM